MAEVPNAVLNNVTEFVGANILLVGGVIALSIILGFLRKKGIL